MYHGHYAERASRFWSQCTTFSLFFLAAEIPSIYVCSVVRGSTTTYLIDVLLLKSDTLRGLMLLMTSIIGILGN